MFYPIRLIYMAPTTLWILDVISSLLCELKAEGILYVGPRPMKFYGTKQQGI